ncbi:MAG: 30S ribosomal protein S2 [Candidatus Levybacteria bacterium]|nr:30S ribosomal protein S2 [Candidatus Levybacteria bacterium]
MREITLEELLAAGCHFGHQVTRSNPKARDFIFESRDNIHIIDLAKTKEGLDDAALFIKDLASKQGTSLLIVGTKRQARGIVEEAIGKVQGENVGDGVFYIVNRWVGGLLTNFSEVSKNFKKLEEIEANLQNEEIKAKYTKKERGLWAKDREKLLSLYGGVRNIPAKPDALFIIDTHLEELAVKEAAMMGVKTVGIVDTNADPAVIDYPIPANDDALGSLKLIIDYIMDAWIEGRKLAKDIENKKTATTETQKKDEARKLSDSEVARKVSGKSKTDSNKKTATTETLKKTETLRKRKRKNVDKK